MPCALYPANHYISWHIGSHLEDELWNEMYGVSRRFYHGVERSKSTFSCYNILQYYTTISFTEIDLVL